jgi:hypothetical protein
VNFINKNNFSEEEMIFYKEFNHLFNIDELVRINKNIKLIIATCYVFNFPQKEFLFDKKKVDLLSLELSEKEKNILENSSDIYMYIQEVHNIFLDEIRKNLNIAMFMDWFSDRLLGLFKKEKFENIENIENAIFNVNEVLYKNYSKAYKNILNKIVEESYQKCIKITKNKEIEWKINTVGDEKYFVKLNEKDQNRLYFENEISKMLNTERDDLFEIFYEIYTYIEFDLVLIFIENVLELKKLPRKDSNHEARKTHGKFNNAKNKMISILRDLGLHDEANKVEKEIHFRKTHVIKRNFDDMLREHKDILYQQLITYGNTPQYRARKIIRIVNYLNF